MKSVTWGIRIVPTAALLALTLSGAAGCTKPAGTGDAAPATSAAAAPSSSPSRETTSDPSAAPSPTPSPILADGRSAVYLTGLDTGANTVTFDLIEFLTGDAAKAEWKKQHPDNPDGPDNDYLIVNNNPKLRTLPVAPQVQCVVLSSLNATDTTTISFAAFPAYLKTQNQGITLTAPDIAPLPFWLTVQHGTVVKFEEQFLP